MAKRGARHPVVVRAPVLSSAVVTAKVLSATPVTSHAIHGPDRVWTETNCYVDLWVELLHSLRLDPRAALAFTVGIDFEGDQWTFIKYPLEDLRLMYGLEVQEYAVWLPLERHILEQIARRRILIIEVDSWFLPDTYGTAYRLQHVKTSIAVRSLDPLEKRIAYFHGPGAFEAEGDDYDGLLRAAQLPPYVEVVKLDRLVHRGDEESRTLARTLLAEYLDRRRPADSMDEYLERFPSDVAWLRDGGDLDRFHTYAFATMRQLGANAELAATFLSWLGGYQRAATAFGSLATATKSAQFKLARVAAGRHVDLRETIETLGQTWREAFNGLR